VIIQALGARHLNAPWCSPEFQSIEAASRETYRQHRFSLSMSPAVHGYTSLRTFNILACGGLALTRDYPGLDRLFEHRKHMLNWRTVDQAKGLMREYAANPEEAERIRKRGWRHGQARHTVLRRLMNMMANLTTKDGEFWGYL
jgi:spore maturation protein CgeB